MDEVEEFRAKGEINVIQGTSFSPGTNATGMDERIEVPCDNLDDVRDGYKDDGFRTPTKKASVPKVGMLFDDVESVHEFYMNYAHDIRYWDMQTKTKGKKIRVHANA